MRTSATGRFDRPGSGFTLVELLVVLAILGCLSVFVALSSVHDPRREAADEADRLRLLLEAAAQEAQWGRRPMAWSADAGGYRFWRAQDGASWQPIAGEDRFRPRHLADGTGIASVELDGQALPPGSLLVFSGAAMPLFRIALSAPQGALLLRSLPNGRIELQSPAYQ